MTMAARPDLCFGLAISEAWSWIVVLDPTLITPFAALSRTNGAMKSFRPIAARFPETTETVGSMKLAVAKGERESARALLDQVVADDLPHEDRAEAEWLRSQL